MTNRHHLDIVHDVTMGELHTLWHAGCTGGINDGQEIVLGYLLARLKKLFNIF